MDPAGTNSSISTSKFGDYAKVHLGDNIHYSVSKGNATPSHFGFDDFLATLNPILPEDQRILTRDRYSGAGPNSFRRVLDDNPVFDFETWYQGGHQRLLWIQDKTNQGHSLLVFRIISHQALNVHLDPYYIPSRPRLGHTRPLIVSYFFCSQFMGTAKCATEVLRGLIYNLLRTDEKALVRPTADPNTHDDVHEFSRLSRVLRKRLQKATAEGYRVILVVEGIDQCADDASEVGVPHLLSTLRDAWKEGNENDVDTNIQCIISSRPSRDIELELRLLDFNFEVIDLESGFVAQELGLEDLIVAIQRDANQLQAPYNSLKDSSRVTESSSWFEYSNAGRDWLRRANYEASPVRTLWYRRSGGNFQPQKLLIACVESLMSKYDNTNPRTLYFSFASGMAHESGTPGATSRNCQPSAIALQALFCQLAARRCGSTESWMAFLVALPETHKTLLRNIHVKKQDLSSFGRVPPSHMKQLVAAVLDTFVEPLVLIFDFLELTDVEGWEDVVSALERVLKPGTRMLFCCDGQFLRDYTARATPARAEVVVVDEHTEYLECLQTLEVNHISLRREQVPDALVQTNRWLWSHASFQRWEEEGGLLWIYGRPGSGKSVLAKTILRELENSSNSTTHLERRLICDWFYNSSGGDVGTAHSFMLRSVLRNILRRSEHLFDKVKHHYRSLFDAKGTNDVAWTTAALCDLLLEISASPAAPDTLIVVDGLDESENGDNLEAKQYFVGFLYKFSQLTLSRVRWIVLSRPEPVIRDAFRGANRRISCAINMDEENEDDINTIIGAGLDGIRAAWERSVGLGDDKETSSSVHATVLLGMATYLKEQANGVILWVSLALNQLKLSVESKYGFSLHDLDKIMRGLPLGLDDFYSKIMLNLNVVSDPERLSTTKAMLTWIIGARRWAPLQLRHLREVMAMAKLAQVDKRPDMDMLESHRPVVRSPRDWSGFRGIIYQHCGPLVEIRLSNADDKPRVAPSSTLEMLHETARSYLKDERRSGVFYIDTVAAEQTVLVESFKYLGFAIPPPTLLDAGDAPRPLRTSLLSQTRSIISTDFSESREWRNLLSRPPRRTEDELRGRARKDYLDSWPLASLAFQVLRGSHATDDSTLITLLPDQGTIRDFRALFITSWLADTYYSMERQLDYSVVELFTRHCCETGQSTTLAKTFELIDGYAALYRSDADEAAPKNSRFEYSVLKGAVAAFLNVALDQPRCGRAVGSALLKECRMYYSLLEDSSSVGVNTVPAGSHVEDQSAGPSATNEGRAMLDKIRSIVDTAYCEQSPQQDFSDRCRCYRQVHIVTLPGGRKSVFVWQVYSAIEDVLGWLREKNHDSPEDSDDDMLSSMKSTLLDWWNDPVAPFSQAILRHCALELDTKLQGSDRPAAIPSIAAADGR